MKATYSHVVSALLLALLTGCADSHQIVRQPGTTTTKLKPNDAIYISVPRDGAYGNEQYPGSGLSTAQTLLSSFAKRARRVEVGSAPQQYDGALKAASERGFQYLVYLTILHWEDRATEWSGIPDRVEVKIEVVDVATDATVGSAIIKGKSGLATFGGDHPQDLLPKPIEAFVATLY